MDVDLNILLRADYSDCTTSKDIYPIVSGFTKAFIQKRYQDIDDAILSVDLSQMNELSMVCLIRTTYAARRKLENWVTLRDRIAAVIPNSQRALRGLYNP